MTTELEKWLIVVPARLKSQRLPEKPLQDLAGKPLIVRVYENLLPLRNMGAEIRVATDSARIVDACQAARIPVTLTKPDHPSGTDRCHEVAEAPDTPKRPFVMNVQGDEPFVATRDLVTLAKALEATPEADIGTLVYANDDPAGLMDPNVVKAVTDSDGLALYFSRASIPYPRDQKPGSSRQPYLQHIGIYAFRRQRLADFCTLKPGKLERIERLEQLRALENGWKILIRPATSLPLGIDTPEDLEAARARY